MAGGDLDSKKAESEQGWGRGYQALWPDVFLCSELGELSLEQLSLKVRVPLVLALLKINSETQWMLVVDEEGDSRAQEWGNPERIKTTWRVIYGVTCCGQRGSHHLGPPESAYERSPVFAFSFAERMTQISNDSPRRHLPQGLYAGFKDKDQKMLASLAKFS